jgi:hypothetical protein
MSKLIIEKGSSCGFTEATVFFSLGGDNYALPESLARIKLGDIKVDNLLKGPPSMPESMDCD